MIDVGVEMPEEVSSRTRVIAPVAATRHTPWPPEPKAPSAATNQRFPSGPAAIELAMAPSAIGNRAICPFGETRSISARLAIQTFRSGPDARLLGRKLRTRGRSESVATSAATPERLSAQ